ncbi:hypothetical protein ACHAW6_013872 [Cyclotella cf. meneghiniana]
MITSFGKYKYLRFPIGLHCSPDIAQSIVEHVLTRIDDTDVYINDMGAFSPDWDHCCEWAIKETDSLGYWLTPCGLKPSKKKIDVLLHMDRPRNGSELCMFIGCVNYYRDMLPSCAHILKPLTDHSGLTKHALIPCTPDMQTAFNKMPKQMN